MASLMTHKGRAHLRNGWGWESRRMASLATPKGRCAPSATATGWDPSTEPSLVLLVLGNRLDRRNRGRFLLRHHEVVVVRPCPHALPSPALAAACGAFGGEPHPRNAPNLHTLPAPRGARVLPVGASVFTRARPLPGGRGGGGLSPSDPPSPPQGMDTTPDQPLTGAYYVGRGDGEVASTAVKRVTELQSCKTSVAPRLYTMVLHFTFHHGEKGLA